MTTFRGKDFLPILRNGEFYIEGVERVSTGREKSFRESYEQARARIKRDIARVREHLRQLPSPLRWREVVVPFRLYPEFLAKSYYPRSLMGLPYLTDVGSRPWRGTPRPSKARSALGSQEDAVAKMIFVRTTDEGLELLSRELDRRVSDLTQGFMDDIRRIEAISELLPEERLLGFDDWEEGTAELVLHPFGDNNPAVYSLLQELLTRAGVSTDDILVRPYPNGPTFVSAYITQDVLKELGLFNPLRTAHPIDSWELPELRTSTVLPVGRPPVYNSRSTIVLGVFDGGANVQSPYLKGYVRVAPDAVPTTESRPFVEHGTAVAGAALFGPLNKYGPGTTLPVPRVAVEMFRVFPRTNPRDHGFYEAIDLIEKVVPKRQDIKVYNLSFGPRTPILDDEITRFTYALDKLAREHQVLFVVAVGNDGNLKKPKNRIQPPSDIVNGLGVGAYTLGDDGKPIRAYYSSIGFGREGCKLKPDLVAFGGCDQRPIHLLSIKSGQKVLSMGTSFAAPIVAGKAAEILGRCDGISPLTARALLIHTAQHPLGRPDPELGHGIIREDVEDILSCTPTRVTVLFQGSLRPTAYARLPIPLPKLDGFKGRVQIIWTVAVLTPVVAANAQDYTSTCIEDVFYPNALVHEMVSPDGKKKRVHLERDQAEIARLKSLAWAVSPWPKSDSGNIYKSELQRRSEFKWDTIVHRSVSKLYTSLHEPFLLLHGMSRNGISSADRIDFAVVVTVHIPKYKGNLYYDVLRQYNRLEPIRLKAINEIMIPVM